VSCKTNLQITDLLALKPVRRKLSDNRSTIVPHNPLVDAFREQERATITDRSRAGYDSNTFYHFTSAIKAVAAFNGIFDLQRPFAKAYKAATDKERRREIKAWKKRVFSLSWVDQEIERLTPEFYRAIKSRASWLDTPSVTNEEWRITAMLCAFFITLLTLRYLGYRQECLRDCVVGKNIIFERDGSITLRWAEDETKNGKAIYLRLNKTDHGESHGLLIDALHAYYKHIHPYLNRIADKKSKGQFFLRPLRSKTSARHRSEASFAEQFELWCNHFLDLWSLDNPEKRKFHAHHLRGLCTDWLVYECGLTLDEVALFIGDSVAVLKGEYLDANRTQDGTPVLDKLNKSIMEKRDAAKSVELQASLAQVQSALDEKGRLIDAILQQLAFVRESLTKAEARNEVLEAELKLLRRGGASQDGM